jgi:hypothetical protein
MNNKTKKETRLIGIIKRYEQRVMCKFKPNVWVYRQLGMKKSRFIELANGLTDKPLTPEEKQRIVRFFEIDESIFQPRTKA